MRSIKIIAFFGVCIACSVTGSNALFGNLIKLPKFEEIFKTIGIPATRSPPKKPVLPRIVKKTTTTTPATTTRHPVDVTIELCLKSMTECPWTSAKLVKMIVKRQNVNTSVEFTGKGEPVGPAVNPTKVGNELQKPKVATATNGTVAKGSARRRVGDRGTVPKICLPFGQKIRNPASYIINCINYLSDRTIPHYTYRRRAMLGCFKCRYLCEIGGAVYYL